VNESLGRLAERLDAISEELADLAIEELRSAIGERTTRRPEQEKRITQARRAVEKAAHLLRSGGGAVEVEFDD
jgi:hypothetical protein